MGFLSPAGGMLGHTSQTLLFTEHPPTSHGKRIPEPNGFPGAMEGHSSTLPQPPAALTSD